MCGSFVRAQPDDGFSEDDRAAEPPPPDLVEHAAPDVHFVPGRGGVCRNCGLREFRPYFRDPRRLGGLIAASFFTFGLGGLVYRGLRRTHVICSQCGTVAKAGAPVLAAGMDGRDLPSTGLVRRVVGGSMMAMTPLLIFAAFMEQEPPGLVFALLSGTGGMGLYQWGKNRLEARKRALRNRTESKILRLARLVGGKVTVTDMAAQLNCSVAEAEALLATMEDGIRVHSRISPAGIVYYEFSEIVHGADLTPVPGLEPEPARLDLDIDRP